MNEMRICKRLVLVGMALGLVLAGCGGTDDPKSNKAEITALILTIGTDYEINFGTGTTAKVRLPEGTTMPTSAIVKSVTLSAGASGLKQSTSVDINANGVVSITITAEDGVTEGIYTVTVKVLQNLSDYSLSYPIAKRSADGSISVSPVWKKGTVDAIPSAGGVSYAIDPALPTGLTLNADGTISGTMPSLDKVTAYQITATGDGTDYVNTAMGTFLDKFVSEETYTPVTTGTAISNIAELQAMTQTLDGEYYLTTHIDLSAETSWAPIASSASPFTGTLHGNGYAIYNLTIDAGTAAYQGLFASVSGATIENLGIGVTSIKGGMFVGALAGYAAPATLSNIAVAPMATDAKIEATSSSEVLEGFSGSFLGGAVGRLDGGSLTGYSLVAVQAAVGPSVGGFVGAITNSATVSGYATGDVTGKVSVGGLVGMSNRSTISSGYATGNVNGSYSLGGLVGENSRGTIIGYATGDVTGTGSSIGGLVGDGGYSTFIGYATGDVTGTGSSIGGLVGRSNSRHQQRLCHGRCHWDWF